MTNFDQSEREFMKSFSTIGAGFFLSPAKELFDRTEPLQSASPMSLFEAIEKRVSVRYKK